MEGEREGGRARVRPSHVHVSMYILVFDNTTHY